MALIVAHDRRFLRRRATVRSLAICAIIAFRDLSGACHSPSCSRILSPLRALVDSAVHGTYVDGRKGVGKR